MIVYVYGFFLLVGIFTVVHWGSAMLRNLLIRIAVFWNSRDYVAALERIAVVLEEQHMSQARTGVQPPVENETRVR